MSPLLYAVNHALQAKSAQTTSRKLAADTAVVERVLEYIRGIAEVKSYSLTGSYNRRLEAVSAADRRGAALQTARFPHFLYFVQHRQRQLTLYKWIEIKYLLYASARSRSGGCICFLLISKTERQGGAFFAA